MKGTTISDDTLWEDGRSIFRPSYSDTWLGCSGSLVPSIAAEDTAGYDAAVGTVFHEVMREWQLNGRPDHWAGDVRDVPKHNKSGKVVEVFKIEIDEDMFVYGQQCIDYVKDIPGKIYVETRVDISPITPIPGQGGTADRAACDFGVLDLTDWKYGKGVKVFAHKKYQLLLYLAGFFFEYDWLYDFQIFRARIAQPRLNHWDLWELDRAELLEHIDWMKGRAYRAWNRKAPRTPSPEACLWCKVRTDCAALEVVRQGFGQEMMQDIDDESMTAAGQYLTVGTPVFLPGAETLTTAHLLRIYQWRSLMESWLARVGEEILVRGQRGEDLEGKYKIVQGRTHRKFKDEAKAVEVMRHLGLTDADIFGEDVISPNQFGIKLRAMGYGAKSSGMILRTLAASPPGRPTLVSVKDDRQETPSLMDLAEEAPIDSGDEI